MIFFHLWVVAGGNLRVRLITQHKFLCKYNLRLLAATCESVWPGLKVGSIYADLSSLFYIPPLRGRSAGLSDSNFDPFRTIVQRSGAPCIPREGQYNLSLHHHGRVLLSIILERWLCNHRKCDLFSAAKPEWILEPRDTTAGSNTTVTMPCVAFGIPSTTYTWFLNAKPLIWTNRHNITGGNLTIKDLTREDNGMYQCFVNNKHGQLHADIELDVSGKIICLVFNHIARFSTNKRTNGLTDRQ